MNTDPCYRISTPHDSSYYKRASLSSCPADLFATEISMCSEKGCSQTPDTHNRISLGLLTVVPKWLTSSCWGVKHFMEEMDLELLVGGRTYHNLASLFLCDA